MFTVELEYVSVPREMRSMIVPVLAEDVEYELLLHELPPLAIPCKAGPPFHKGDCVSVEVVLPPP